jgi:hypothetical protein
MKSSHHHAQLTLPVSFCDEAVRMAKQEDKGLSNAGRVSPSSTVPGIKAIVMFVQ